MTIFKDESGQPCGFKWWWRWKIAKWHLRGWLRYEGMPRDKKTFSEMQDWAKNLGHYIRII